MKEKIFLLIIGILIGAIITAGGFLIFNKVNSSNNQRINQNVPEMKEFTQMERPNKQNRQKQFEQSLNENTESIEKQSPLNEKEITSNT